jgi:endonuclease YncB( thermonuclease family)
MGCIWSKKSSDINLSSAKLFSLEGVVRECYVLSLYDGDTCTVALQMYGLNNKLDWYLFKCRLEGIDTPEMTGTNKAGAIAARNYLIGCVSDCPVAKEDLTKKEITEHLHNYKVPLIIKCGKWDKYGRLLGTLFRKEGKDYPFTESINHFLINNGLAVPYSGGKKERQKD